MSGIFIAGILGNNGSTLAAFVQMDQQKRQELPGSIVRHGTVASARLPVRDFIKESLNIPIRGWDVRRTRSWNEVLVENDIIREKDITKDLLKNLEDNVKIIYGVASDKFINLKKDDAIMDVCSENWGMKAVQKLKQDVEDFALEHKLQHVTIIYSGSTEANVEWTIDDDQTWPASVHYAMAALHADVNCSFVNAAAQNSISIKMIEEFDKKSRICVVGNDLSTGQTKLKRNIADMLLSCGFPIRYVASTNYLSNLDGYNLQGRSQNKSKIVTKTSMLDACVTERPGIKYEDADDNIVPHHVNIAYVEGVGDNKLALDEFNFNLAFNNSTSLSTRMTCKDTLLALPLLFDLAVLLPIMTNQKISSMKASEILSYYFKNLTNINDCSQFLLTQLHVLTEWICLSVDKK
jgi:myo-inositol-1-phosphate synthase